MRHLLLAFLALQAVASRARAASLALLALLLGAAVYYNLYLLAPERNITGDEETGVAESLDLTFAHLAFYGPAMELNNAPLHYLFDRALLKAAGYAPHRSWDLAVFFRLLPMLWVSLFIAAAFLFVERNLRGAGLGKIVSVLAALLAALFLSLKPFVMSYGLDARPYALWLLLSFLQLALFLELYRAPKTKTFLAYALVCTLLVLTAYVSMVQLFVAGAILVLRKENRAHRRAHLLLFAALGVLAASFLLRVHVAEVAGGQARAMLDVLLDIAMVAFRPWSEPYHPPNLYRVWAEAHLAERACCLLGLLLPLVHAKREQARPLLLFAYGLLLCLLPVALVLELKSQGVGSARYLLFLLPALFSLFLVAVLTVAHALAALLGKIKIPQKPMRSVIFLALLAALAGQALHRQYIDLKVALQFDPQHLQRKAWGLEVAPACPQELGKLRTPKGGVDLVQLRKLCTPARVRY